MTNVNDAIAQAAANSQTVAPLDNPTNPTNAADAVFNPTAVATQNQTNQVATQQAGAALSMDDSHSNGQSVEHFIKLGDEKVEINGVAYPGVVCELVMADCSEGGGLRKYVGLNYSQNEVAKYSKSYDGINTATGDNTGKTWNENIQIVQSIAPKAKTFIGFDLALTVAEDTKPLKAGDPILEAGTILGYSTTMTGSSPVDIAYKKAKKEGRVGDTALVEINGLEVKSGSGFKYKKFVFKQLGYLGDDVEV